LRGRSERPVRGGEVTDPRRSTVAGMGDAGERTSEDWEGLGKHPHRFFEDVGRKKKVTGQSRIGGKRRAEELFALGVLLRSSQRTSSA